MNFNKKLAVAVSGAVLLMAGQFALADSTTDIVDALVSKGVLTEEEGKLISKGHAGEKKAQDKSIKGKLSISNALDNANFYGDMRVRYEYREGSGQYSSSSVTADAERTRPRGKMIFGVNTAAGNWYSDVAFAVGGVGRTDNFTFGGSSSTTGTGAGDSIDVKPTLNLKRAMLGFKATDWLTIEAGKFNNPLYTTPMVWDADLSVAGLTEKLNYKAGNAELFANLVQMQYTGDRFKYSNITTGASEIASPTNELLAFQAGLKYGFNDNLSAKAAVTYYDYTHGNTLIATQGTQPVADGSKSHGVFVPGLSNTAASSIGGQSGVNNLSIVEIPAELNCMVANGIGVRAYGDYAWNTDADARAQAAANTTTGTTAQSYLDASGDDKAWLLGLVVGSASDLKSFEGNKMKKGDWQARVWYQDVGVYSLDPNTVDSDFMDSRLNMKGTVLKGQYNVADNVMINLAAGHATRKNKAIGTPYAAGNDIGLNLKDFDLYQVDLTYKF
jgi:polyhydroxyalkanoate synthesis regulator phasin